jgi:hypothetical protein
LKEKQWYAKKIKKTILFFSYSLKTSIVNLVERTLPFKMQISYYYLENQKTKKWVLIPLFIISEKFLLRSCLNLFNLYTIRSEILKSMKKFKFKKRSTFVKIETTFKWKTKFYLSFLLYLMSKSYISDSLHTNWFHNRIFGSGLFCCERRTTESIGFQEETPHLIIGSDNFNLCHLLVTISYLLFVGWSPNHKLQLSDISCGKLYGTFIFYLSINEAHAFV